MTTALFHGAAQVVPCLTVEDACLLRSAAAAGSVLLGGERGGVRIEGFELSNSPADYAREIVAGKTIGFTTTNGTKTLLQAAQADRIIVGAFVNLSMVVQDLQRSDCPVHLLCAGTDGHLTGEDILFAGAVVDALLRPQNSADVWRPDDGARVAHSYWLDRVVRTNGFRQSEVLPTSVAGQKTGPQSNVQDVGHFPALEQALRDTRGGRNLQELGYSADIALCSRIDSVPNLPVYSTVHRNLLSERTTS